MPHCDETIRGPKTGLRRPCPGHLNEFGECSQRVHHLWRAKSGWCATKSCEGKKPEVDGIAQGTCKFWQKCPCECHDVISHLLAPKRQQREAVPDKRVREEAFVVGWIREYDKRQKLLNNPELRVKDLCKKWLETDRSEHCTIAYIISHSGEEKPLTQSEVVRVFNLWLEKKTAFIGGEPQRFISFMKAKTNAT